MATATRQCERARASAVEARCARARSSLDDIVGLVSAMVRHAADELAAVWPQRRVGSTGILAVPVVDSRRANILDCPLIESRTHCGRPVSEPRARCRRSLRI